MTTANAIKKLERKGYTVEAVSERCFQVSTSERVLQFRQNGPTTDDSAICIGTRPTNDYCDPMTDYSAFTFYDNITQAMRCLATK